MIDREAPRRRRCWPVAGHQDWRSLLFLHWPVPVEMLRPLVPRALDIDLFEGAAWVSLTPFLVRHARPVGVPRSLGLTFLETNVRTYVHRRGRDPGIYFFSLDATSSLAVAGARVGVGLPYFLARASMHAQGGTVRYRLERRRLLGRNPRLAVDYRLGPVAGPSEPGTLQFFLIERYLLHEDRPLAGGLWTVQVHHAPYPVHQAEVLALHDELLPADGLPAPAGLPALAHFSPGVDVDIFAPRLHRL